MNIAIVSGSHRLNSQTLKVSTYISEVLNTKAMQTALVDLGANPLPLVASEDMKSEDGMSKVNDYKAILSGADAIVMATPEWGGGATPGIMNAFRLAGSTIAHKPVMLVAVSASRGGSYPISEMKAYGFKNNKGVAVPDYIIVHNVQNVLNKEEGAEMTKEDIYMRERIDWSLENLIAYMQHMRDLRIEYKDQLMNEDFAHGMS